MESIYHSWMSCIHDKRWADTAKYMHPAYEQGSTKLRPIDHQSFVAHNEQTRAVLGEDMSVTTDSIIADPEARCLAVRILVECSPVRPFLALEPTGRRIRFFSNEFVWFADGKVSKLLAMPDVDGIRQQASAPAGDEELDRMGTHAAASPELDSDRLKAFYRSYIASINEGLSEAGLAGFCQPTVVHNAKPLSLSQYCSLIDDSSSAVRDMTAHIHTIVADRESQRIAARLEWVGTPIKELAGAQPNGRAVRIAEHVTYQLEAGKISRVWSVVDWEGFRAQMASA